MGRVCRPAYNGPRTFAKFAGTDYHPKFSTYDTNGLRSLLEEAENLFQVAEALQFLLWTLEGRATSLESTCARLREVFDLSPGLLISIVRNGNEAFIYPTGIKLRDEAAIEGNLIWLSRYPLVLKNFGEALKLYASKDAHQYRNMLDNLRFSVEQMLQAVLGNGKTLENQKPEFQNWLKRNGVHGTIGGMYHTVLFGYFTQYQNDAVKHHEDDYTAAEVEFVLYLTGTFLRFIQRLLEEETAAKTRAATS